MIFQGGGVLDPLPPPLDPHLENTNSKAQGPTSQMFSLARFSNSYLYIWDHPLYIFKGAQVGIPNEP